MGKSGTSLLAYFGRTLRYYRQRAGLTQEQLGEKVGWSAQLIGHVEQGVRSPQQAFTAAVDEALGADHALLDLWRIIHDQATPDERFRDFVELEATATEIHTYESHLIPGLLQTEDYVRAVQRSSRPPLPPDEIEARVMLRLSRQEILTRDDPPRLWAIVSESALHQQVGDGATMRGQLQHLVDCADSHLVTLQVLPYASLSPAMGHSFSIFIFRDAHPIIYQDLLKTSAYHRGDADTVAQYRAVYEHLREQALREADSIRLLASMVKELG